MRQNISLKLMERNKFNLAPNPGFKMHSYRNDIFGFLLDIPIILFGPLNVIIDCVCKEFFGGLAKEGNTADEELVENDTHAPPIHGFSIA